MIENDINVYRSRALGREDPVAVNFNVNINKIDLIATVVFGELPACSFFVNVNHGVRLSRASGRSARRTRVNNRPCPLSAVLERQRAGHHRVAGLGHERPTHPGQAAGQPRVDGQRSGPRPLVLVQFRGRRQCRARRLQREEQVRAPVTVIIIVVHDNAANGDFSKTD